jgi:hypothetical protein
VNLHEFLDILDADPCQVDADIGRGRLDVGKIFAERLFRGVVKLVMRNRSSHPKGCL